MAQTHYTAFTVQTGQVTGTLTDFPVGILLASLARLETTGNGGNVADANGFDIRPYSDSGLSSALTYELVFYDETTGALEMYVKVPSLTDSSIIYLGYGDAALNTDGSSTGTWDTNYVAVYHLGDGSSVSLDDSTSNARTLTDHASVAAAAGCIVGGSASFNGTTQYLDRTATATLTAWPMTLECLMFPDADNIVQNAVTVGNAAGTDQVNIAGTTSAGVWRANPGSAANSADTAGSSLVASQWNYGAGVFASDTSRTSYCNAATPGTNTNNDTIGTVNNIGVGALNRNGSILSFWDGLIDEVRFSNTARSAAWVEATRNNLLTPSSFYTTGTEQAVGGGGGGGTGPLIGGRLVGGGGLLIGGRLVR